jgi:hypothetical protein
LETSGRTHTYLLPISVVKKLEKLKGGSDGLKLRAGVRINFAIQANFLKNRCCPLHDISSTVKSDNRYELASV